MIGVYLATGPLVRVEMLASAPNANDVGNEALKDTVDPMIATLEHIGDVEIPQGMPDDLNCEA